MMMGYDRPDDRRHEPTVAAREHAAAPSEDEEESSDGEFEFPFVSRDAGAAHPAPADELFAGGRIRAFYPVFGRVLDAAAREEPPPPAEPPSSRAPLGRLFQLEKARTSSVASTSSSSSSASAASELDGASPDSYCLWAPGLSSASAAASPSRPPRKSGSTGSMARWRRIGELVVGRSHSDGREKFLFLSAPASPARDHNAKKQQQAAKRGSSNNKQAADVNSRLSSYGHGGAKGGGGGSPGAPRRTFLPYRQDLVGLFANVQGLRRSHHHPF